MTGFTCALTLHRQLPGKATLHSLDPDAPRLLTEARLSLAADPVAQKLHSFLWARGELVHKHLAWPVLPFSIRCAVQRLSLVDPSESLQLSLAERIKQKLRRGKPPL